jgi:hypothetical protein
MTDPIRLGFAFPILKISGLFFIHIVLFVLLLIHGIHHRLLFDVQTGLDTFAIQEALL